MPIISQFYGILIYIYHEKFGQHHSPHFHAQYGDHECSYDFAGEIIAGQLPRKQHKLVQAWCALHEDELNAAWKAWNEYGEIIKIEGLR